MTIELLSDLVRDQIIKVMTINFIIHYPILGAF